MKLCFIKDAIGGMKLVTEKGQTLDNIFVKSWKKDKTLMKVTIELICIIGSDGKNW